MNAPDVACGFGQSRVIAASSVHMDRFHVRRSKRHSESDQAVRTIALEATKRTLVAAPILAVPIVKSDPVGNRRRIGRSSVGCGISAG